MDKDTAIAALSALAHPIRIDAFRLLVQAGAEGLTPSDLVAALDLPYAKLGFHLKELTLAGLVTQEPSGRNVIYRAAYDRMNGLLAFLMDNCCRGVAHRANDAPNGSCGC